MATLQIRKKATKTWLHVPSDHKQYIVSKLYCKFNGDMFRVIEWGGRQRAEYHFSDITIYDDTQGGAPETFGSAVALMLRLEALEYIGFPLGSGSGGVGFQPTIVNPLNGQTLIYNSTTGIWHNGYIDVEGNRFLQIVEIPPAVGNVLTIPIGFIWVILNDTYSLLDNWVEEIPYTSEDGMIRKDIIVAIAGNNMIRIEGQESDTNPLEPTVPPNTLLVTQIDVFHDSIGEPTEPIIGSNYIPKQSERWTLSTNITSADIATPIIINGNLRNWKFQANIGTGTFTIRRLDVGGGTGFYPFATIWDGMKVSFANVGVNDITIKHFDTSLPSDPQTYKILLPNSEDVILKTGETINLSYDLAHSVFRLSSFGKLFSGGESLTLEQARQNGNVLEGDVEFAPYSKLYSELGDSNSYIEFSPEDRWLALSYYSQDYGSRLSLEEGFSIINSTNSYGYSSLTVGSALTNHSLFLSTDAVSKGFVGGHEYDKQGDRKAFAQISDLEDIEVPADQVSYDNTASGLLAETVQEAVDELSSYVTDLYEKKEDRVSVIPITANTILSAVHHGKILLVTADITLTIPTGLGAGFTGCAFRIATGGKMTPAFASGVTSSGFFADYNPGESLYVFKESGSTNVFYAV